MVVLILHQTEEINLIKWRKNYIYKNQDYRLFPTFPLWIDISCACKIKLSDTKPFIIKNQLKDFGRSITNLSILPPVLQNGFLISPVTFFAGGKEYSAELTLAKATENDENKKKSEQKTDLSSGFSSLFPINPKIYRLGIAQKNTTTHSIELEEFLWIKNK